MCTSGTSNGAGWLCSQETEGSSSTDTNRNRWVGWGWQWRCKVGGYRRRCCKRWKDTSYRGCCTTAGAALQRVPSSPNTPGGPGNIPGISLCRDFFSRVLWTGTAPLTPVGLSKETAPEETPREPKEPSGVSLRRVQRHGDTAEALPTKHWGQGWSHGYLTHPAWTCPSQPMSV